jgi:hypothetical protein
MTRAEDPYLDMVHPSQVGEVPFREVDPSREEVVESFQEVVESFREVDPSPEEVVEPFLEVDPSPEGAVEEVGPWCFTE